MATVKIGHAVANENGKATGGKPGDQTGKEVRIADWYDGGWEHVFRPKSADVAEMIASNAEKICNNNNIGYDQNDRTSAYAQAVKVNFALENISKKCSVDCSSMVALCCVASGISVAATMYTGNEQRLLMATNSFTDLHTNKYLLKSNYLKRGDILLKAGHTAVVLTDGSGDPIKYFKAYMGTSNSIVDALFSIKVENTFAYRKKIANANGIKTYLGTASQNLSLVALLKEGKLIVPSDEKK